MPSSPITIVQLNIEHYQKLLRTEADESKRRTIAKLLAEEEAKLVCRFHNSNHRRHSKRPQFAGSKPRPELNGFMESVVVRGAKLAAV